MRQIFWALSLFFVFQNAVIAIEPPCAGGFSWAPQYYCFPKDRTSTIEAVQSLYFQVQLKNTYGSQSESFSLVAGETLPPGASLSSSGVLSGIVNTAGNYQFQVKQGTTERKLTVYLAVAPQDQRFKNYDFSEAGPYEVQSETYTINIPAVFGGIANPSTYAAVYKPISNSSNQTYGTLIMFNGTGFIPEHYHDFAQRIASWGFIVAMPAVLDANGAPSFTAEHSGAVRTQQIVDATINFLANIWVYRNEFDLNRLAIGGHSIGAELAQISGFFNKYVRAIVLLDPSSNFTGTYGQAEQTLGLFSEYYPRIPTVTIGYTSNAQQNSELWQGFGGHPMFMGLYEGAAIMASSKGTHNGLTVGYCSQFGENTEEELAVHLPITSHFTVAHLMRYLNEEIQVNGALFSRAASEQTFITPEDDGYSLAHNRFGKVVNNSQAKIVVDDFAIQTQGNESYNLSTNSLLRPITETTLAAEGPPLRYSTTWTGMLPILQGSAYRVRQLNAFGFPNSLRQILGTTTSPLNVSNYQTLSMDWARITNYPDAPVTAQLKDVAGNYSNQVLVTPDEFKTTYSLHTVTVPLSAFSGVNLAQLVELKLYAGALFGLNYDLDNIAFEKAGCQTDAKGLHPSYYSNELPNGKFPQITACGLTADGMASSVRVTGFPAYTPVRFYISSARLDVPSPMYGGLLVPRMGAGRSRAFTVASDASGNATLNIPHSIGTAELVIQAFGQVSGLPAGQQSVSEPIVLRGTASQQLQIGGGSSGSNLALSRASKKQMSRLFKSIERANKKVRACRGSKALNRRGVCVAKSRVK